MTTESSAKLRTITLTNRPPVRIAETAWPIIASARRHDGQVECQANHVWHLTVRQHADGRTIVYGSEDRGNGGMHQGYEAAYAGELLESSSAYEDRCPGDHPRAWRKRTQDIVEAICRVGKDARCSEAMIRECLADLPAEDLT